MADKVIMTETVHYAGRDLEAGKVYDVSAMDRDHRINLLTNRSVPVEALPEGTEYHVISPIVGFGHAGVQAKDAGKGAKVTAEESEKVILGEYMDRPDIDADNASRAKVRDGAPAEVMPADQTK
jgi:hypothetical protein